MAKQEQVEKVEKVKRISRSAAANTVLAEMNGKTTLSDLAEKADGLFVAAGGKSVVKDAAHFVKRALETAESLGVVKLTRPTDIMVEKVKPAK